MQKQAAATSLYYRERKREKTRELTRTTGEDEEANHAELPMEERRMKEQRGETEPGRSDEALQRSMKRASIIQQL